MNDEQRLNAEQLWLATSRRLPADTALDAETAAWREGFIALGSALETAVDETDLLDRLRVSVRAASDRAAEFTDEHGCLRMRQELVVPSSAKSAAPWALLFSAALAAATLIAIVRIGTEWQRGNNAAVAVVQTPGNAAVAQNDVQQPVPLPVGWNDPLDDELALAAATMGQFSAGRRGVDESLLDMNQELFLLSQELLGESL